MSKYIVLLDPSLQDNKGTHSHNLGDVIIYRSVKNILNELLPDIEIVRISTHQVIEPRAKKIINQALFTFVGGTNILTSHVQHFKRLIPERKPGFFLFPGFKNLILLGTGWNNYTSAINKRTAIYYNRILSGSYLHSLRDIYSEKMLRKAFIRKTIFTGCPTTWNLQTHFNNQFNPSFNSITFTLTDYNQNKVLDEQLLQIIIAASQREINFFPQGKNDLDYLRSLQPYIQNKSRFSILPHHIEAFDDFLKSGTTNYIGTRLHGGIRCLQYNLPTVIIGIDNRGIEMGKDLNLPIILRSNLKSASDWINGYKTFNRIELPLTNIERWKNQFIK